MMHIVVLLTVGYFGIGAVLGIVGQVFAPKGERDLLGFVNVLFEWPYVVYLMVLMLVFDIDPGPL
jgi:hypothetical protein